jgi:hypothetical protein
MNNGASEEDAHIYAETLRRGGTLLTVHVSDDRHAEATRILAQFSTVTLAERGAEFRQNGWQRFDETAPPYKPANPPMRMPPVDNSPGSH